MDATIAQKLATLALTKENIRKAINQRGGSLTSGAAFSLYPSAISNLPLTTVYPLDTLGYDSDGKLRTSMDATAATVKATAATASYLNLFANNSSIRLLPNMDFSQTPSLQQLCNNAPNLAYIPYITAPKATTLSAVFRMCTSLKYAPGIAAALATDCGMLFGGDAALEYVGELNLPKATGFKDAFASCAQLRGIGSLTLPGLADAPTAQAMFYECTQLREFVAMDFAPSSVNGMFSGCSALREVRLSLGNCTNTSNFVKNCPDAALWLNWNNGGDAQPIKGSYPAAQTYLDFTGATNWGTDHPASLAYTIEHLIDRHNLDGTAGTPCAIGFSAQTKAALTAAQIQAITSKNYTIS